MQKDGVIVLSPSAKVQLFTSSITVEISARAVEYMSHYSVRIVTVRVDFAKESYSCLQ